MRPSRRRLAAVIAVAVLGLGLSWSSVTAPAAAGGPTSVLLVSPDARRTASLYADDPDYDLLAGLLGAFADLAGSADAAPADAEAHATGPGVTVTWLIHDVQVWRVDRIYLQAAGGPWVSTEVSDGGSLLSGLPETWRVPARGAELAALLARLGLGIEPGKAASTTAATPTATPAPASTTAATSTTAGRPDGGAGRLELVLAGLLGALAGAGVVLSAPRLRSTRRPVPADPASDDVHGLEFELLDPHRG